MKLIRHIGSLAFVLGLAVSIFGGIPWAVVAAHEPPVPVWLQVAVFCLLGGILVVLASVAIEQKLWKVPKGPAATGASPEGETAAPAVILSNAATVPGREITESLGLVQGHTVYAIWLGKDLSAIIRLIVGGELTEYTEMMGKAREAATQRMIAAAAAEMDADAVINVRYMTTSVVASAAELLVYGTAVKLG